MAAINLFRPLTALLDLPKMPVFTATTAGSFAPRHPVMRPARGTTTAARPCVRMGRARAAAEARATSPARRPPVTWRANRTAAARARARTGSASARQGAPARSPVRRRPVTRVVPTAQPVLSIARRRWPAPRDVTSSIVPQVRRSSVRAGTSPPAARPAHNIGFPPAARTLTST